MFFRLIRYNEEKKEVEINPELMTISCFKKLVGRDRKGFSKHTIEGDYDGRRKYLSTREIAFVFWEGVYMSPYHELYPDKINKETNEIIVNKQRHEVIKRDVELPVKWEVDSLVQECIDWFKFSQKVPEMRYMETATKGIENIIKYIEEVDITETIKGGPHNGELVHDPIKYTNIYKQLNELTDSYLKTKERVRNAMEENSLGRGGESISKYQM